MVLTFPIEATGDFCLACGQSMVRHPKQCERDVTLGQDQHAIARRLRLARLQQQSRGAVRPWAIDADEVRQ